MRSERYWASRPARCGRNWALLRRYRSAVRHWGEGRLTELVAPSLTGPETRQAAGAFERAAASPAMAAALVESLGGG